MNPTRNNRDSIEMDAALAVLLASECIPPARLWEVRLGGGQWQPIEREHLDHCDRCRARADLVPALPTPLPEKIRLFLADKPLRRFAAADAAAQEAVTLRPEERLHFPDNADIVGSFYHDDSGRHWLDLTHLGHAAGTLLLVRLGPADPSLQRFVMLRPSYPLALGRLGLNGILSDEGQTPEVGVVTSAAELTADLAAALKQSFEAAVRDDPAALGFWQSWAARELAGAGVPEEVVVVLKEIARAGPSQVCGAVQMGEARIGR
jgi:hypothetical protein